ncbi:MAG: phytochromobilin:ferredoxin oxidoreductase, partial [Methanosarcinaceae archaeon]|nr:phytochromobilin:ferredoxin oxidoreductase [Methanosarcinaceae archaeon]
MSEDRTFNLRFNQLLHDEMSKCFDLKPLPFDEDFKIKHSTGKTKEGVIKSDYLECAKTGGIRMGEMDYGGAMTVHFGSIPPGKEYNFPIFGFTFVWASKFLIAVLDLHPISKEKGYMETY